MLIARASEMTTIKNFGNGTAALPVKLRKNTPTSPAWRGFCANNDAICGKKQK
jgi:hypothetical protein